MRNKKPFVMRGGEIIEGHLMEDHIYVSIMISPKLSVSSFMGYLIDVQT